VTYWLAISNRDNWEIVKKENIWGVAYRHRFSIEKVKKGDVVLFYVSSQKIDNANTPIIITGVFEVLSSFYIDKKRIFLVPKTMDDEVFPYRIKLKPIKIFREPIEFKPIVRKMKFITNKKRWGGHIRGKAMRVIPEEDYKFIMTFSENR